MAGNLALGRSGRSEASGGVMKTSRNQAPRSCGLAALMLASCVILLPRSGSITSRTRKASTRPQVVPRTRAGTFHRPGGSAMRCSLQGRPPNTGVKRASSSWRRRSKQVKPCPPQCGTSRCSMGFRCSPSRPGSLSERRMFRHPQRMTSSQDSTHAQSRLHLRGAQKCLPESPRERGFGSNCVDPGGSAARSGPPTGSSTSASCSARLPG